MADFGTVVHATGTPAFRATVWANGTLSVMCPSVVSPWRWVLFTTAVAARPHVSSISPSTAAASSAVAGWTQEQYDKSFRYEQAQAEIDALRRRVAELERDAIAGQEAQRENERMRDLLGLAEQRPELQYRDAAVVRRASSNWTSDLTINRGTSGGVEAGDCVIDQYGHLIGVVTQADLNSSLVTTILDPTLELGGRIARTDEDAILKGDFSLMLEGLARLSYLPEEARLVTGDQVITSGLGGVYPPGLAVGTVRSLITEEDGLTRYAQVEPAADIGGVQYVYVIVDYGA